MQKREIEWGGGSCQDWKQCKGDSHGDNKERWLYSPLPQVPTHTHVQYAHFHPSVVVFVPCIVYTPHTYAKQSLGGTLKDMYIIDKTHPRAISRLLMSFLIFQISTLRSADVSSPDILLVASFIYPSSHRERAYVRVYVCVWDGD